MNIWRLMAHHVFPEEAVTYCRRNQCLAVGWCATGDLTLKSWKSQEELGQHIIRTHSPDMKTNHGGPCLWNFLQIKDNDIVIMKGGKTAAAFRAGDYYFDKDYQSPTRVDPIADYGHRREAVLLPVDAYKLLELAGGFAEGQSSRWSLAVCKNTMSEDALAKLIG